MGRNLVLGFMGCVCTLSACGGGGQKANPAGSYEEHFATFDAIESQFTTEEWEITLGDNIPTEETAAYDGVIYIGALDAEEELQAAYLGEMHLDANFSSDSVSGSASNFYDSGEGPLSGTLGITEGSIDRMADPETTWQYTADLNGVLTDSNDVDLSINGFIAGDFYGPSAEGSFGIVEGNIHSVYGPETAVGSFFLLQ